MATPDLGRLFTQMFTQRRERQMAKQRLTPTGVLKLKATDARQEIADASTPGLHLIIQPTGSKSWALRFRRPDGKQAKLFLGAFDDSPIESDDEPEIGKPLTLAAARSLAAEIARQRARGTDVVAERRQQRLEERAGIGKTFGLAVPEFIEDYKSRRGWRETAKMLGLDYPLDGGEPKVVTDGLADRWKDKAVRDVSGDDIYAVISEAKRKSIPGMAKIGTGTSESRGRHLSNALRAVFKWLKDHRRIDADPTVGVHRPKPPPKRQRILNTKLSVRNADELRWLWRACDQMGAPFGSLVKVLLLTGQRRDEIADMQWRELDDEVTTLSLPGSRTKNKLPHQVAISAAARDVITAMPKVGPYVFASARKYKKPFKKDQAVPPISGFAKFKARLDELMTKASDGAEIEQWQLHDLRRTCSSGMAAIKIAPHIVEAVLNHISGAKAGVAGVYNVEQYDDEKRLALEAWSTYVMGVVESPASNVVPMRRA